jgi:hypothetical protein
VGFGHFLGTDPTNGFLATLVGADRQPGSSNRVAATEESRRRDFLEALARFRVRRCVRPALLSEMRLATPLVLAFLSRAAAATFTVATTGLDTNPGTEAEPWRTIQKAANTLAPGDAVRVRGGVYAEHVTVNVSGSATNGAVTFAAYPGETPILDATGVTPPNPDAALFLLIGKSYVTIRGFELRNDKATAGSRVPCGIMVRGPSHHLDIRDNDIHDIWYHTASGNAFGIAIYGDSTTPMTRIVIDGNRVHHCRTGNSETIVVNGNVTDFEITNNRVHDNTNIGIDCIGYEGTCPDRAQDRARDGVVRGNVVWNCTSTSNPAYGNAPGAGGLYVDGGTRIVFERNVSFQNDIGIELASEHSGTATDFITVRDNVIYRNKIGGLYMGGYASTKGRAENCTVRHNTFWENDTLADGAGEALFQWYVTGNTITHNVFVAGAQNYLFINPRTTNSGNVIDYNLYFAPAGAANAEWRWGTMKVGFNAWRAAVQAATPTNESHSSFADPRFVDVANTPPNFHLRPDSPAIEAGDPALTAAAGELDLDAAPRRSGARVDLGADEFAFAPTEPPQASVLTLGAERFFALSFRRPVAPTNATYVVESTPNLATWVPGSTYTPIAETPVTAVTTEVARSVTGAVQTLTVRGTTPIAAEPARFLRLRVNAP